MFNKLNKLLNNFINEYLLNAKLWFKKINNLYFIMCILVLSLDVKIFYNRPRQLMKNENCSALCIL